jgi:hypothetical protein
MYGVGLDSNNACLAFGVYLRRIPSQKRVILPKIFLRFFSACKAGQYLQIGYDHFLPLFFLLMSIFLIFSVFISSPISTLAFNRVFMQKSIGIVKNNQS